MFSTKYNTHFVRYKIRQRGDASVLHLLKRVKMLFKKRIQLLYFDGIYDTANLKFLELGNSLMEKAICVIYEVKHLDVIHQSKFR